MTVTKDLLRFEEPPKFHAITLQSTLKTIVLQSIIYLFIFNFHFVLSTFTGIAMRLPIFLFQNKEASTSHH